MWDELKLLKQLVYLSWLVCSDFNEILYNSEKKEGLPRDERRMEAFRATLVECGLFDIGFSSLWFTWEKGNIPATNYSGMS